MEEDVGIVLDEGVVINRHSIRRILRGPGDLEKIVRFILIFVLVTSGLSRALHLAVNTHVHT